MLRLGLPIPIRTEPLTRWYDVRSSRPSPRTSISPSSRIDDGHCASETQSHRVADPHAAPISDEPPVNSRVEIS